MQKCYNKRIKICFLSYSYYTQKNEDILYLPRYVVNVNFCYNEFIVTINLLYLPLTIEELVFFSNLFFGCIYLTKLNIY